MGTKAVIKLSSTATPQPSKLLSISPMELTMLPYLANPMPLHKTYTTHMLEKNIVLPFMLLLIFQFTNQPHTTQHQYTNLLQFITQLQLTNQPQFTTQPQFTSQLHMSPQLYMSTDMLSMMTMLTLTSKPTNTVTDMPP